MVGELIDLLQPYRGRGDGVIVYDTETTDCLKIIGVYWNPKRKHLEIEVM